MDSYILHGPASGQGLTAGDWETWGAMETLYQDGKARLLGISNVTLGQLQGDMKRGRAVHGGHRVLGFAKIGERALEGVDLWPGRRNPIVLNAADQVFGFRTTQIGNRQRNGFHYCHASTVRVEPRRIALANRATLKYSLTLGRAPTNPHGPSGCHRTFRRKEIPCP